MAKNSEKAQHIESALNEKRSFPPSPQFAQAARLQPESLAQLRQRAQQDHVGFWAEDLSAGQRALDESGLVARVHDASRPARFSYHPFAGGLWIELVHTSFKSQLADWIADTLTEHG